MTIMALPSHRTTQTTVVPQTSTDPHDPISIVLQAAVDSLVDTADARQLVLALHDGRLSRREGALLVLARARDWRTQCAAAHSALPAGDLGTVLHALMPGVTVDDLAAGWTDVTGLADELDDLEYRGVDAVHDYAGYRIRDRRAEWLDLCDNARTELTRALGLLAGKAVPA